MQLRRSFTKEVNILQQWNKVNKIGHLKSGKFQFSGYQTMGHEPHVESQAMERWKIDSY
jgi:hypothetical protein